MKLILGLGLPFALSVFAMSAMADLPALKAPEGVPQEVESVVTKITCTIDFHSKNNFQGQPPSETIQKGKSSEAYRETWHYKGVEYRFSKFTSFASDGTTIISVGRSNFKFEAKQIGNQVIETYEGTTHTRYIGNDKVIYPEKFRAKEYRGKDVFLMTEDKRFLISSELNGEEQETRDAVTYLIDSSAKRRTEKTVQKTPYIQTFENGGQSEVLKDELTCTYEVID